MSFRSIRTHDLGICSVSLSTVLDIAVLNRHIYIPTVVWYRPDPRERVKEEILSLLSGQAISGVPHNLQDI